MRLRQLLACGIALGTIAVLAPVDGHGQATYDPAAGQPASQMAQPQTASPQMRSGVDLEGASHLLGMSVRNKEGAALGDISDIVLNDQRDGVSYIVLGRGGVMGMGQTQVAIPWNDFKFVAKATTEKTAESKPMESSASESKTETTARMGEAMRTPQLDIGTTELAALQPLKEGAWPDRAPSLATQRTETMSRKEAPASETKTEEKQSAAATERMDLRRVSKLIGAKVESTEPLQWQTAAMPSMAGGSEQTEAQKPENPQTTTSRSIGDLKDVLLNTANGQIIYCVIAARNIPGHEEAVDVVAPWSAVRLRTPMMAELNVPNSKTLLAYDYAANNMNRLAERNYAEGIFQAYRQQPHWEALGFVSPRGEEKMMKSGPAETKSPARTEEKAPEHRQW